MSMEYPGLCISNTSQVYSSCNHDKNSWMKTKKTTLISYKKCDELFFFIKMK